MVFTGQVFLTATWYARRVTWKNTHIHSHTQTEGENVGCMLGNFNDPIFLKKKNRIQREKTPQRAFYTSVSLKYLMFTFPMLLFEFFFIVIHKARRDQEGRCFTF